MWAKHTCKKGEWVIILQPTYSSCRSCKVRSTLDRTPSTTGPLTPTHTHSDWTRKTLVHLTCTVLECERKPKSPDKIHHGENVQMPYRWWLLMEGFFGFPSLLFFSQCLRKQHWMQHITWGSAICRRWVFGISHNSGSALLNGIRARNKRGSM